MPLWGMINPLDPFFQDRWLKKGEEGGEREGVCDPTEGRKDPLFRLQVDSIGIWRVEVIQLSFVLGDLV